jgi:uncharacterized protein (DUF2344 family)
MTFSNAKISVVDAIKVGTIALGFIVQYYAFKSEIREQFMENAYHNKTIDVQLERLENSDKLQTEKINNNDIKLARIFTMLYKDAKKPKETQIETELEKD